jgi:predicted O-methyltransferase YrrM
MQLKNVELEETVIPIVTDFNTLSDVWTTPLSLIFIDGEHDEVSTVTDYINWSRHLVKGGYLIFHDVWPERHLAEEKLKLGPHIAFKLACNSGLYTDAGIYNTLGILKRL